MSRDVDTNLSRMPRWAVIPLVFITCLVLAAVIMCTVRTVGHLCPFGCQEDEAWSRQQFGPRGPGEIVRPHNASDDTMTLAVIRPPPPAYTHPPQYGALFMTADAVERGVYRGNSQVVA